MSSIDERVVEMRFKDSDFKAGIKRTLDSLGQLKKSLELKGATDGLENVKASASKFSLEGIAQTIEGIKEKFSSLSVVGIAALATLASKAVDVGIQMSRGMIKPMTDGFAEYELKLGSIQTIMAGTGDDLQTVNAALDELNHYADKTIYSFSDMTDNIGKFTNAGVDLDKSVAAIQGVANVAAISGANSNEASRAMYNFSQALSIGYVGLMDWKSIELANMGTAEFRQQLINSAEAMGTLKKQSDGTWKTLEGTTVTVENFRNTLADQWLTADALTETLGKYADETTDIGKRATAAATEVKTFSHLMDTLAEAQGSGWAKSMEIVIGDFDEAKSLWTAVNNEIGGIIDAQADARNKMLQDWKDAGGRDDLIAAFSNIWNALKSVVDSVKGAFRDIFPPSTTNILSLVTSGFLKLSELIKMGAAGLANLRPIFTAVFAVLKAGVEVVSAIVRYFAQFAAVLGGGIFAILASLGALVARLIRQFVDWVRALEPVQDFFRRLGEIKNGILAPLTRAMEPLVKAFEQLAMGNTASFFHFLKQAGGEFEVVLERIIGYVGELFGGLQDLGGRGAEFLRGLGIKALEPFADALDWVVESFNKLRDALTSFELPEIDLGGIFKGGSAASAGAGAASSIWQGILDTIISLKDKAIPILEEVGSFIGTMVGKIKGYIEGLSFQEILALVNTGFFIMAYRAFKQFQNSMTELAESAAGALDELGGALKGFQQQAKANIILQIAIALGILAAAVYVLAQIDVENLVKALVAIGVMLTLMLGALSIFKKFELGDQDGMMKTAAGLILLSIALKIMSSAVEDLAELDWEGLAKGLIGVGTLLGALVLFTKLANVDKGGISTGAGLILLGVALKLLVGVVEDFGTMDIETLRQGMISVGLLIAGLAIMVRAISGATGVVGAAAGLLILAGALVALEFVINRYAEFDFGTLVNGLAKMVLVVAALGIALIPASKVGPKAAASLILVSGALLILSGVLKVLAGMEIMDLVQSVGALVITLGAIAIALNLMNGTAAGAGALLVATAAIAGLAAVMVVLGAMDLTSILKALGAIAGVLAVIGLAGVVLAPVVPVLLALGVALGILGAAMLLAGAGFLAFATGFSVMAAVGVAGVTVLVGVFEGLIMMIPLFLEQVGLGIIAFARVIADSGPPIVEALTTLLISLLEAVENSAPQFGETFLALIQTLLTVITEISPMIFDAGMNLIQGFLEVLRERVPDMTETALELLAAFLNAMADNLPDVIEAGTNLLVAFINGITDNLGRVIDAVTELIVTLITGISDHHNEILTAGFDALIQFITGIGNNLIKVTTAAGEVVAEFIREVGAQATNIARAGTDALVDFLSGIGNNLNKVVSAAVGVALKFIKAIGDSALLLILAGTQMVVKLMKGAAAAALFVVEQGFEILISFLNGIERAIRQNSKRIWDAGWGIADAIVDGLVIGLGNEAKRRVKNAAIGLGAFAVTMLKRATGVQSPSKYAYEIGVFFVEGFTNSLEDGVRDVARSAEALGATGVKELKQTLSNAGSVAMEGVDLEPTIRPVLDLSQVRKDASLLQGLLPDQSISVVRDTNRAYDLLPKLDRVRTTIFDDGRTTEATPPPAPTYIQNNYSPKALSRIDIYRQTNNQLSTMRRNQG